MSRRFFIKQGDTGPVIRETCYNADGTVIDLTGASAIYFHLTTRGGDVLVNAAGEVADVDGVVAYTWVDGDSDTVGTHLREWELHLADGSIVTVPNDRRGYETVITAQGA